ncbi:hypothetical protein AB0D14_01965 [Streptomyces sp. NPDC048484]|uniref:hypothetical protein n=1 Tax=Streptomyces sp. NPDC048484 TaxID=3155146 RepID=UPI0034295433
MSHALTSRQRHIKAASAVDLGVLYSTISAGMLLIRRYLTGRGVDQEFADRYGSAFGRTAAKIYRTGHGVEPRRAWSNVNGKWRRVNGYLPTETETLDEAFTTYKRTAEYVLPAAAEPAPAEVYVKEAGHYPAQFADLNGESLRTIERASSTEAVSEFVKAQLADLDTWQRHYEQYDRAMVGEVDQAARAAVQGLPWDDPQVQTLLNAERGQTEIQQARDILNAAYVDWSFDLTGTVEIPEPARPASPVIAEGCRIPGCDGTWHYDDGICVASLGEVRFEGEDVALPAELVAPADGPRHIVAFAYNMTSLNFRREMRDRTSARTFVGQLRALGDAIDDASAHLPAAS